MNKKTVSMTFALFCLLIWWVPFSATTGPEKSRQAPSGTILINVDGGSKYHDFAFPVSTKTLKEVAKGEVVIEERNGRSYVVCQGSSYRDKWKEVRGLQSLDEDQFKLLFDQYDLTDIHALLLRRNIGGCDPKISYPLRKGGAIHSGTQKVFPYLFTGNEQKTFAVYNLYPGGPGLLIDLDSMAVSKSFCDEHIYHIVWDKAGVYLAYAKSDSADSSPKKVIALKDVRTNAVILEKSMDRYVADIAWNPLSDHIVVLTYSTRTGYWPWEILSAVAGHPVPHNTFYLSIYDLVGRELLTQQVMGNVVYGMGSLVWIVE